MDDKQEIEYYLLNFGLFKIELWIFILSINIILFIVSYTIYRIIFFHGYQVSLDKTFNILQSNSEDVLIESKKTEWNILPNYIYEL